MKIRFAVIAVSAFFVGAVFGIWMDRLRTVPPPVTGEPPDEISVAVPTGNGAPVKHRFAVTSSHTGSEMQGVVPDTEYQVVFWWMGDGPPYKSVSYRGRELTGPR